MFEKFKVALDTARDARIRQNIDDGFRPLFALRYQLEVEVKFLEKSIAKYVKLSETLKDSTGKDDFYVVRERWHAIKVDRIIEAHREALSDLKEYIGKLPWAPEPVEYDISFSNPNNDNDLPE